MTADEVSDLIECHSNEDIEEVRKMRNLLVTKATPSRRTWPYIHNLQNFFSNAKGLQKKARKVDDNVVRAIEFNNRIDDVMAVYKSIFTQKTKLDVCTCVRVNIFFLKSSCFSSATRLKFEELSNY